MSLLWILNLSDGNNTLLDIADRSGIPFEIISKSAEKLMKVGLLKLGSA